MKLIKSLLFASSISAQCPSITTMDWWTDGHEKISCTNGKNIGSKCKIQCNAPWVSSDAADPNGFWKVECRGNNSPKWKTPTNGGRSDHSCTLVTTTTTTPAPTTTTAPPAECPKTSEQVKPRGAKIVSTVTKGGVAVGLELKLRFDTKYTTNNCEDFTFALKSSVPFPDDTAFQEGIQIVHIPIFLVYVGCKNSLYIPDKRHLAHQQL